MMKNVHVSLCALPDVTGFHTCPCGSVVVPHFPYMGKLFQFWNDDTCDMHKLPTGWTSLCAEECKALAMLNAATPMDCGWRCCTSSARGG